jgi:septal ring factor EnvC (AmiA/AmiB activator)
MKSKVAIVILLIVCAALGVALVAQSRKHAHERKERDDKIALQMEDLQKTHGKLEEQTQVNMKLEGDLNTRSNELVILSNQLSKTIGDLDKSDAQAKATAEQLRTAQAELAKKDQKINELENERIALGKQMDKLTNSIVDLQKQIAATEKKLATTRGEKEFLLKELGRMRTEKAELERKFNDIAVLRGQISTLKEEMAIARRLEFIRLNLVGVTAKGGAEKLMQSKPVVSPGTNYDLNVEIRQGGGARIVTPTNAAASTNTGKATNAAPRLRVPISAPPK